MKINCAKRILSLVLTFVMLFSMMSVLSIFGVSAETETTQIASLTPDEWDYTAEDGKFYFESNKLYNYAYPTTIDGRAIVSKVAYNLGQQFTANYVIGAKTKTSNYPSNVDYGIAFRVGSDLEVLVWHDSKWGTIYNDVTDATTMIPKVRVTYKGAKLYEGEALKRADGTTKLGAGVNNNMTKGTYTVHYEKGLLSLTYTLWNVPYDYLYTVAEDGTKTNGINLAELVPDFNADNVIFNDKVSVSLICAGSNDVMSLESFSLSSVPAAPPAAVTSFIVASADEAMGVVVADENNPTEIVAGDRLTYTAVANEGYRFAGWFNAAGTALAATPTATFQIYEGTEVYAKFISSADHTQVAKPNRATILCLGDSITDGYCIASGYRSYLMKQLYAEGAYFDFSAGKYRDDDDVRLPVGYRNHGGLTGVGFKAYGSLKAADTYLDTSMGVANADIALVMLGTNDYSHYADASDYIGESYRAYLDTLYEQNPNLVVFVASVINQKTMATPAAASGALNEQLPEIVAEYKAAGKDITFVDMCNLSGLTSDDFADAVHPNESGAEKIANVWYNAIVDKVFEVNALGDDNYKAPEAVESVSIVGGEYISVFMQSTDRVQLRAATMPLTAEMTTVTWQSSDESIIEVDPFGNVTALREGEAVVTATSIDGGYTASVTVEAIDGAKMDSDMLLFSGDCTSAEQWAGDTGLVNTGSNNIFANYTNATKSVYTADTFDVKSYFRLHFAYCIYGNNTGNHGGKYNEISFGGYALRFDDCARTATLYINGTEYANIYSGAAITSANEFDILYSAGYVEISVNGVVVAQFEGAPAPVESAIAFNVNEPWRASYVKDIALYGSTECWHDNSEIRNNKESTCTEDGYSGDTYCFDCEAIVFTGVIIPAMGHAEYDVYGYGATCEAEGLSDGVKCSTCGVDVVEQVIIPKLDHTEETVFGYAPGCDFDGLTDGTRCSACGVTLVEQETIPATGHNNIEYRNKYDATCGNDGYTGDAWCVDCGAYLSAGETIPATGNHVNTEIREAYPEGCTWNGYTGDIFCVDCGNQIETGSVIPATNHPNAYIQNESEATCGIQGYTGDTYCPDCQIIVTQGNIIPATGDHQNIAYRNAYEPGCEYVGYQGDKYCADCQTLIGPGEIYPAIGHINTEIRDNREPTCAIAGYTGDEWCLDCQVFVKQGEQIPATGDHAYGDWVVDGLNGTQTKTCGTCGDVVTEPYDAADDEVIASGNWNEDGTVTWSLTGGGELTLSGTGDAQGYAAGENPVFDYRDQVKKLVIGDGITSLGSRAFRGMTGLTEVTFGKDMVSVSYEVFYSCLNLKTVNINEGFKDLGSLAFYNTAIEAIELPSTLEDIQNRVFKNCKNLTYISIPDSVTHMGYEVFMGCTSLTGAKWSANVSYINSMMFNGCTSLTELEVPGSIWDVRSNAFTNSGLKTITITSPNCTFRSDSFNGCYGLTIKGVVGSKVHTYAKRNGFTFEAK